MDDAWVSTFLKFFWNRISWAIRPRMVAELSWFVDIPAAEQPESIFLDGPPSGGPDGNEAKIMSEAPVFKSTTRQILISEPDEEQLQKQLAGREVSPKLARFLTSLFKNKKWPRKINIPSAHDNLAAVLVFTSELKEAGLEIFSELHVFFADSILVEKWKVMGAAEETSSVPKEAFSSIEIEKVRTENGRVNVTLVMPVPGGENKTFVRTFDFNANQPTVRVVPHPLI